MRYAIVQPRVRSTRAASMTSFGTAASAALNTRKKNGVWVHTFAATTAGNAQVDETSHGTASSITPVWRSTAFTTPVCSSNMYLNRKATTTNGTAHGVSSNVLRIRDLPTRFSVSSASRTPSSADTATEPKV